MDTLDEFAFSLEQFRGTARLFPLPNLVMFPHVVQPLHVFEGRYCELLEDALADDGLIAMGLLVPGWESEYEGRPPVSPAVCLGRVIAHSRQSDGHYSILLAGLQRGRLVRELAPTRSFREVQIELLPEIHQSAAAPLRPVLRRNLMNHFRDLAPYLESIEEPLDDLFEGDIPLNVLTDIVSFTMKLGLPEKLELLAEADVDLRARRLDTLISGRQNGRLIRRFVYPPQISLN